MRRAYFLIVVLAGFALGAGCDNPAPSMKGQPAPVQQPAGEKDKKAR